MIQTIEKTAEKYFEENYGESHIYKVCELQDYASLYGLINEYTTFKFKEAQEKMYNESDMSECFEGGRKYWSDIQTDEPLLFKPVNFLEWISNYKNK